jgi:hypothetical protein
MEEGRTDKEKRWKKQKEGAQLASRELVDKGCVLSRAEASRQVGGSGVGAGRGCGGMVEVDVEVGVDKGCCIVDVEEG